ncbi:MAG: peptidylprolyl isomerase [Bacteroidales bacterium]
MSNLVTIKTTLGNIKVMLYDQTPLHRDNFLKLVKEKYYDGTIFHRVIKGFMIQAGDPHSKEAPAGKSLGTGGPGYTIAAEIVYPQLFHKRGVLAAARQGDEVNPDRASSGSQFYIVWGEVYSQGKLGQLEKELRSRKEQEIFNALVAQNKEKVLALRKSRDQAGLMELQQELLAVTNAKMNEIQEVLTPAQKEAYTTIGGTPHLDGQYTVFGEVIEGLDIVQKIQQTATGAGDRPKEDIRIQMV